MKLLERINNIIFNLKFFTVPVNFIAKNKLFELQFDNNWVYSKKGNSFYSFHNIEEDLKGGLQFTINWNVTTPDSMSEEDAVINLIEAEKGATVKLEKIQLSKYSSFHYFMKYDDSNMDIYKWIVYEEKVLIIINFMIFEEEPESKKLEWLKRVKAILETMVLDHTKFQSTRMK